MNQETHNQMHNMALKFVPNGSVSRLKASYPGSRRDRLPAFTGVLNVCYLTHNTKVKPTSYTVYLLEQDQKLNGSQQISVLGGLACKAAFDQGLLAFL